MLLKKRLNSTDNTDGSIANDENGAKAILGYLQDFGLNEKEAKVFFVLSKVGYSSAGDLTNLTELNRLQCYRAIKTLLDKGLVEMSLDRPRIFTPLKIEQVLNLLQQEAERKILDLEKKAPLLIKEWSSSSDLQFDKTNYTFRIIQGNKNVLKFRIMLCESAKKEIAATMKPNELMKLVIEGADDVLEKLNSNNVSIRNLSEVNEFNVDASKRFLQFSSLNHTSHPRIVPFILIDRQEALICLSRDGNNGVPENAIWTNHPEMVEILMDVFEMLWKESQNGALRINELENTRIAR